MFRCTDCNAEYKIKPDYCDCGNNTFEEVPQAAKSFKAIPARQIVSIVIFIFCLILAIIPWTIPDKKPQKQPAEPQKSEKPAPAIPNIDKIWNNTVKKIRTSRKYSGTRNSQGCSARNNNFTANNPEKSSGEKISRKKFRAGKTGQTGSTISAENIPTQTFNKNNST